MGVSTLSYCCVGSVACSCSPKHRWWNEGLGFRRSAEAMAEEEEGEGAGVARALQELHDRGQALWTLIVRLPTQVITPDCRARLLKAVHAEHKFVDRLLSSRDFSAVADAHLRSSNFGHLEGIAFVLQQQSWRISGASACLRIFQTHSSDSSPTARSTDEDEDGKEDLLPLCTYNNRREAGDAVCAGAHVDLICTLFGEAVWVVVVNSSVHNRLWLDRGKRKGLQTRIRTLLHAASLTKVAQPSAIVLVVRDSLDSSMEQQLKDEFSASLVSNNGSISQLEDHPSSDTTWNFEEVEDGDWVNIDVSSNLKQWPSYWIRMTSLGQMSTSPHSRSHDSTRDLASKHVLAVNSHQEVSDEGTSGCGELNSNIFVHSFWSSLKSLQGRYEANDELQRQGRIVNLDTTALVALVSELTNGGAEQLAQMSSDEMERRFPKMAKFVYEQALVELDEPLLPQLEALLVDKVPVVCEYVYDEFTSIYLINGGPREKQRAQELLGHLKVLPNIASVRMTALPETGKIKARHKLVFGSGDFLQAPTVTANMAFVRAVQQQGMALAIFQHQPCALTGD